MNAHCTVLLLPNELHLATSFFYWRGRSKLHYYHQCQFIYSLTSSSSISSHTLPCLIFNMFFYKQKKWEEITMSYTLNRRLVELQRNRLSRFLDSVFFFFLLLCITHIAHMFSPRFSGFGLDSTWSAQPLFFTYIIQTC